jgi:hypothetical protein
MSCDGLGTMSGWRYSAYEEANSGLDLGLEAALDLIELLDTRPLYDCLALRLSKAEIFSAFPKTQCRSLEKDNF